MSELLSFGLRLRSERERLGKTLAAFSASMGVSKGSQINYECGSNEPNRAYIAKLRTVGVDSHYVMYGEYTRDFALNQIDWELCEKILGAIRAWEKEKNRRMPVKKKLAVLRTVYSQSVQSGQINADAMHVVLKLVA